ncbi:MAG: 3-phosphoserine/phosphohydroxythreonine transaminase [Spirochaetes bacterium]|nr:3-phosphoserine/phosphohydroxythreonine transaminase [Spirochaetota bacterium]
MDRVFNFSAGPAGLPLEVLKKAQTELVNYGGTGMSVMEMSHRSAAFEGIITTAEALVRELMGVPENYSVMFLQGGASTQFAMVPLNLFKNKKADYIHTGAWADKAIKDAQIFGEVRIVGSSKDKNFSYIPKVSAFNPDSDYVHITSNETITGTRYATLPQTGNLPLVADMSSNILSEQLDVSKFGLIYAGAQKNLGPSGVALVIMRKDLIGNCLPGTPTMLQYKIHDENKSLYNTPPCYSIYILKLVLEWVKAEGGVKAIEEKNIKKAGLLYDFLDNSKLFQGTAAKEDRSLMNIPFILPNDDLNKKFIDTAKKQGFVELKGHRSVGGMRASIYNAMPIEGVKGLVELMKKFEQENS